MVIRSGSIILLLTYLVMFGVALGLLASVAILIAREFRTAARLAAACIAGAIFWILAASAAGWLTPQRIVNIGDSYCWDLWCMGIDRVNTTPQGQDVVYRLDVRIFSDANNVKTRPDDAAIYLMDERNRRYPLIGDPSAVPFNTTLDPGQTIKTTLTFIGPSDASHLFLMGEAPLPDPIPLPWRVLAVFADLHFGYERLSHKPTLLRVL